ncbi:MAG TPA: serpin family protein [Kofleriaceae bacterium]
MKRLLSLALLAACTDSSTTEIPEVKSDVERELQPNVSAGEFATLVDGNTEFAADLYKQVKDKPGNLFMSPHSISIALAMTYAGANTNTATQMAAALHFDVPGTQLHAAFNKLDLELASRAANASGNTIPFRLKTANAIFGQKDKTFEGPFLDTLARNYGAGMRVLDFNADPEGSRETINRWVEEQTNDKIKDLLPMGSITDATRLVLSNAIYFSAAWDEPFKAEETADRPFKLADGTNISVSTLHQSHERGYAEGDGYKVAELPYDGGQLSMVVIVPDDLESFEASLDGARIKAIMDSIQTFLLDLTLPKFKFDAPLGLKEVLMNLGMVDAFTDGIADFSGIDGTRNLVITDVLHKGFVAIDEKGTEAAAATAVIVGDTSAPLPATLVVDKPFLFMIRDRPTGAILFVGRVVDPR